VRPHRRQHFPGRAFARAALLPAAGAGLGVLPDAGQQPLYVRLGDASRRRHHGRERAHRQPGHPERMEEGGELTMPIGQKVLLIGGGHNALITAYYLAKGGFKPVVLERREIVGGGAVTEEFHPGFRVSTLAHTVGPLRDDVLRDMQHPDPRVFAPTLDGQALLFYNDHAKTAGGIARMSAHDAESYTKFAAS